MSEYEPHTETYMVVAAGGPWRKRELETRTKYDLLSGSATFIFLIRYCTSYHPYMGSGEPQLAAPVLPTHERVSSKTRLNIQARFNPRTELSSI